MDDGSAAKTANRARHRRVEPAGRRTYTAQRVAGYPWVFEIGGDRNAPNGWLVIYFRTASTKGSCQPQTAKKFVTATCNVGRPTGPQLGLWRPLSHQARMLVACRPGSYVGGRALDRHCGGRLASCPSSSSLLHRRAPTAHVARTCTCVRARLFAYMHAYVSACVPVSIHT